MTGNEWSKLIVCWLVSTNANPICCERQKSTSLVLEFRINELFQFLILGHVQELGR